MLLDEIENAEQDGNDDRIEGVLCGAVKQLKMNRAKPDITLYLSLMFLAKIKPNLFATEGIIEVRFETQHFTISSIQLLYRLVHDFLYLCADRPCAVSFAGMPPSTSKQRATVWCLC